MGNRGITLWKSSLTHPADPGNLQQTTRKMGSKRRIEDEPDHDQIYRCHNDDTESHSQCGHRAEPPASGGHAGYWIFYRSDNVLFSCGGVSAHTLEKEIRPASVCVCSDFPDPLPDRSGEAGTEHDVHSVYLLPDSGGERVRPPAGHESAGNHRSDSLHMVFGLGAYCSGLYPVVRLERGKQKEDSSCLWSGAAPILRAQLLYVLHVCLPVHRPGGAGLCLSTRAGDKRGNPCFGDGDSVLV